MQYHLDVHKYESEHRQVVAEKNRLAEQARRANSTATRAKLGALLVEVGEWLQQENEAKQVLPAR